MSKVPVSRALARLLLAVLLVGAATGTTPGHAAPLPVTCQALTLPVTLTGAPDPQAVAGKLCAQGNAAGKPLLILVSGATYGSAYWDLTPALSVVQAEAKTGFSVLTYDRLGIGQSTKPASTLLTVQSDADVLHQLVQAARAGRLGQTAFATILTVGHSLGSGIVLTEAATAQDVQGVVATGFAHYFDPIGGATFQGALWPAQSETRADLQATPPGYFTTQPGKRSIFYYNGDATVIATDEATKQTVTDGELTSFPSVVTDGGATSQQIRVPVLGLVGDHEPFFCSAVGCPEAATEGQYYSAAARFQMQVIQNTGHDLATQASSPQTSAIIAGWAWSVVGTS